MIDFVTIFPDSTAMHLRKDVGMIPALLQRDFGFRSRLVCSGDILLPAIQQPAAEMAIERLGSSRLTTVLHYIYRHAAAIDVLNLYHHSRMTLMAGWLFKRRNPEGILYLKLDAGIRYFEQLARQPSFGRNKRVWNAYFKNTADIVSCESNEVFQFLLRHYPAVAGKLLLLPNGIDIAAAEEMVVPDVLAKEPVIMTAGRIGAAEKGHELLLEAMGRVALNGWQLILAGPLEEGFPEILQQYIERYPQLAQCITCTGAIFDPGQLYRLYRRAGIFVLSSTRENFPMVLPEAMFYGCYVVATDVGCVREILEDGRLGTIVDDVDGLAGALQQLIGRESITTAMAPQIIEAARSRFDWRQVLEPLRDRIVALKGQRNK